jgi:1,4-alpha-glucan branching enzyme
MPLTADILDRKATNFVLWRPSNNAKPPSLIIGQLQSGNPPVLTGTKQFPLTAVAGIPGLWQVSPAACGLQSGQVYHYWFQVEDTASGQNPPPLVTCTDPFAFAVDWRLFPPGSPGNTQPATVIKFENGKLVPADPGGEVPSFTNEPLSNTLPPNNQIVIYELPTAWTLSRALNEPERAVGTFRDVQALVDETVSGANFEELAILDQGKSYLTTLGVNALELLPPADSFFKREWGYNTSHFPAPDYELGYPEGNASPTANSDLATLVQACHNHKIRVFVDVVMAFSHEEPYQHIDRADFYIDDPQDHQDDPDAKTSGRGGDGHTEIRNGFGSVLFRYSTPVPSSYDPITGKVASVFPARQLMLTSLTRWMRDFHVDGYRMDSVENVASWEFVGSFKDTARFLWKQRWADQGLGAGADERFLVVGEELTLPFGLLTQGRLDGLWNDTFHSFIRAAILGQNADGEPSFEWTVRKGIDCRIIGFTDGAQAINYLTSHDVEGFRRERLFTMLTKGGLSLGDTEKRIKLAFVCLLTAVGVPMILAGEEFADQHDFFDQNGNVTQNGGKQINPVNFSRLTGNGDVGAMRRRIFNYVSTLIKFRTQQPALAVNDTDFIHVDFNDGKRVVVWKRGSAGQDPVVVLANFSDFTTPNAGNPSSEYVVPNWPPTPAGRQWREVTQNRPVPANFVGREPIFAWEAKVYTLA